MVNSTKKNQVHTVQIREITTYTIHHMVYMIKVKNQMIHLTLVVLIQNKLILC